jgi:hypothetical protein
MAMKAYHYNSLKFYDKEIPCQIDPLESERQGKTVYLTPKDCTLTKPTIKDGYTPRWNGKTWEQYANDKIVYGYTNNDDGTINYYGSAHTEEELTARIKDVDLLFSDNEPVSVDGVYWMSADNPDYIKAKEAHDKEEALTQLDAQYNADKADLLTAYQTAMLYGDTDTMESLKADLQALDEQYDEDYERIVGEG